MKRQRGVCWTLFDSALALGGSALALGACIGAHDSLVGIEDPDGTGGSRAGSGGSVNTGGSSPQGGSDSKGGTSSGGSSGVGGSAGLNGGGAGTGTGARGGGGSSGNECNPNSGPPSGAGADGFILVPDCNGWIDRADNPLGVQGWWYPFGDQYQGPYLEKCILVGMHAPADCSVVRSPPPPPALGFPQAERGTMCTNGEVAVILPCAPGVNTSGCPENDYANMSGAGIAVDFNADRGEDGGAKHSWDPSAVDVIGFSFEIDQVQLPLRIEIPMVLTDEEAEHASLPAGATTDEHPDGSPYWGASQTYPPSPVMPGVNRVLWSDIRAPRINYQFDPTRMLGIQFHVPAVASLPKKPYAFCIKNLTLLEQ